jgi:deoxyribodipyrimidine photolyase
MLTRIIVWLRQDLRMKDNYALNWAMNYPGKKEVIPIFCYDPRIYFAGESGTKYGTRKTGAIRA